MVKMVSLYYVYFAMIRNKYDSWDHQGPAGWGGGKKQRSHWKDLSKTDLTVGHLGVWVQIPSPGDTEASRGTGPMSDGQQRRLLRVASEVVPKPRGSSVLEAKEENLSRKAESSLSDLWVFFLSWYRETGLSELEAVNEFKFLMYTDETVQKRLKQFTFAPKNIREMYSKTLY